MELRLASHEVAIGLQGGFVLEDLSQYNPRAFHRNPNSSSLVQNFDEFCPSTVSLSNIYSNGTKKIVAPGSLVEVVGGVHQAGFQIPDDPNDRWNIKP